MSVMILCEGRTCNGGFDAKERERAHVTALTPRTADMLLLAEREARTRVARELRYTPHERVGVGRGGTILFACEVCGHERVYGTHAWTPSGFVGAINP